MCHLAVKQNNISILALLTSYRYFFEIPDHFYKYTLYGPKVPTTPDRPGSPKSQYGPGIRDFCLKIFFQGKYKFGFKNIYDASSYGCWKRKSGFHGPKPNLVYVFRSSIFKRTKRSVDPMRKSRIMSYFTPKWCKNRCPNKPWTDATYDCRWKWSQRCCCSSSQVIYQALV